MSYDGIVTHAMVETLKEEIVGAKINRVRQNGKETLHLSLYHRGKNLELMLSARADRPAIYFVDYKPQGKEVPTAYLMFLRKYLTGGVIESVQQHGLDRIVILDIAVQSEFGRRSNVSLVAELMGKYSNLILIDETKSGVLESAIRVSKSMSSVREIYPGTPYFLIESGKINVLDDFSFRDVLHAAEKNERLRRFFYMHFEGFSPLVSDEILFRANIDDKRTVCSLTEEEKSTLEHAFLSIVNAIREKRWSYSLYYGDKDKPIDFHVLDLNVLGPHQKKFKDLSSMLLAFYADRHQSDALETGVKDLGRIIERELQRERTKLETMRLDLDAAKDREDEKLLADLILANQHLAVPGADSIEVVNFYDPEGKIIRIDLDPAETVWQNAQRHYKNVQKKKNREKFLTREIPILERSISYLEQIKNTLLTITTTEELDEVREELESLGLVRKKHRKKSKSLPSEPVTLVSSEGAPIYIGRNNRQNDRVTMHVADRDDLFIHIKDLPGPHVILAASKVPITERSIEEAVYLAVAMSKFPFPQSVDYTRRRNVKKSKGAKPGMVYYENFETAYVREDEDLAARITLHNPDWKWK